MAEIFCVKSPLSLKFYSIVLFSGGNLNSSKIYLDFYELFVESTAFSRVFPRRFVLVVHVVVVGAFSIFR